MNLKRCNNSIALIAATLVVVACGGEADEAKKLGFASVAEMKEIHSKGWHTKERYEDDSAKTEGFKSFADKQTQLAQREEKRRLAAEAERNEQVKREAAAAEQANKKAVDPNPVIASWIWKSSNLEDEATCTSAAMVYLNNYKNLPQGLVSSFQNAQKAYGGWITTYNEHAAACNREMGNVPLKEMQSCIIKKMGNGIDYQFGYSYLRQLIGYDTLLKSGRMSKMDLEMQFLTCVEL